MTDLQMTKLCAEAIGQDALRAGAPDGTQFWVFGSYGYPKFDPLHDDAQAMALVKRFGLAILQPDSNGWWCVSRPEDVYAFDDKDLNRAIVGYVAKMEIDRAARETSTVAQAK